MWRRIGEWRPPLAAGVPTIPPAVFHRSESHSIDLSFLRLLFCGGAALPRSLAEGFQTRHKVRVVQGWGLTETSPVAAVAHPPRNCPKNQEIDWTTKTGRLLPGVEMRSCEGGTLLPWDGYSGGEIEARERWITASYYG